MPKKPFHISPNHTRLETNYFVRQVNLGSRFSKVNKIIVKKELRVRPDILAGLCSPYAPRGYVGEDNRYNGLLGPLN